MAEPLLIGRSAAVVTASDSCFAGTQVDRSGPALLQLLQQQGAAPVSAVLSPDDLPILQTHLQSLSEAAVQLILTTGGTGLSSRDNTPEATQAVCQRLVPGLAEKLRREGESETPFSVLSRGVCGIAGRSLIINLPGSLSGALHGFRTVLPLLPHALDLLAGRTEHRSGKQAAGSG